MGQQLSLVRADVARYIRELRWDGRLRLHKFPFLKELLPGAVARVRCPRTRTSASRTPVLLGDQGGGKSRLLRALGGEYYRHLGSSDTASGIVCVEACAGLICELSVEAVLSAPSVKSFLTASSDVWRAPFARSSERVPRTATVVCTTNETGLDVLQDSRRFLVVRVHGIDVGSIENDRDQLWAEAAVLSTHSSASDVGV